MLETQLRQSKLTVILYDKNTLDAAVAAIPLDADVTGQFIKTLVANFSRQNPAANPAYMIEKNEAYKLGKVTGDVDIINECFKNYLIPEQSLPRKDKLPEEIEKEMLNRRNYTPTPQLN